MNLQWEPVFSPVTLALASALVMLLCAGLYTTQWSLLSRWRAAGVTGLRLAGTGLLLFLLFNPVSVEDRTEETQGTFALLLDTSRSMRVEDCAGDSRMEAVRRALRESDVPAALMRDHSLFLYGLDEALNPLGLGALDEPLAADGARTALEAGLASALESAGTRDGLAGMLLLSDGQENAGGEPEQVARRARARGVPVWTVCVGSDTEARDVAVVPTVNEDYVFVNHTAHIQVDLYQTGFGDRTVLLRLWRGEELLASRPVAFQGLHHQRLSLPVEESEPGLYRYVVKVEPLEGEAEERNNERTVFIRAINEKIRVLLMEGSPHWETKFLVAALREDEHINVSSLFQLTERKSFGVVEDLVSDVDRPAQELKAPQTAEEFAAYDAVILGREVQPSREVQEALRDYVAGGGNVLFARGPVREPDERADEYEVLRQLEPVIWGRGNIGRYRLVPTTEGRASAVFEAPEGTAAEKVFGTLPEMLGAAEIQETRAGARVLAAASGGSAGEPMAVMVYQPYGAGRSLLVDAEGLWRWGFLRGDLAAYDSVYPRFWGQLIRWLVAGGEGLPGQRINFKTDRLTYNKNEQATFYIFNNRPTGEGLDPRINVTMPSGKTASIRPLLEGEDEGVYVAVLECAEEGQYDAVLETGLEDPATLEWSFTAYQDSSEDLIVTAQPERMRRIAELSGGALLGLDELGSLPERIREAAAGAIRESETEPWWDTGWLLALIVGIFGLEWFLRRRSGLY